jgi:autophagy-related protein 13
MSAPSRARAASLTGGDRSRDVLASRSSSAASSQIVGIGGTAGSTSGSGAPSRADQIIYRFYLKTVGVLVDGRVTHFTKGEPKKDRWVSCRLSVARRETRDTSLTYRV